MFKSAEGIKATLDAVSGEIRDGEFSAGIVRHGALQLTDAARIVLKGGQRVELRRPAHRKSTTPSKSNADYFRGTVPFMTVKDMHVRFIADTQDHITEEALEDSASRLIPAGTLVVASRMSLGKT